MKISKLSEHIGHGTHMFHVSVFTDSVEGSTAELYMVAANDHKTAIRIGLAHAMAMPEADAMADTPAMRVLAGCCEAYEIGEIEP